MGQINLNDLVQDLLDEADLCRNETATDIADLLEEAAYCIAAIGSQFKGVKADLAAAHEWREAVLNELIVAHIYTKEHDTNPRKAIQDAITWNCQIALDPAVSSDARKLVAQERERAAKVCEEFEPKSFTTDGMITRAMCAAAIRRGE